MELRSKTGIAKINTQSIYSVLIICVDYSQYTNEPCIALG
jgi:hypothetical protein